MKASRRVLFLDFDGVLHPPIVTVDPETMEPVNSPLFCWLPHLERVLRPHPDVSVVVVSTWRYKRTPAQLAALLGELGPRCLGAIARGPQYFGIVRWLELHQGFEDFCVLGHIDDTLELPWPRQIPCDSHRGVSDLDVQQALTRWLRGDAQGATL